VKTNGKQPYDERRGQILKREREKALTRNSVVHVHAAMDDFQLLGWLGSQDSTHPCSRVLTSMATSCF